VVYGAEDEVLVTGGYDQCVKVWDCRSKNHEAVQSMRAFKVGAAANTCYLVVMSTAALVMDLLRIGLVNFNNYLKPCW
jgi:hypothetical protein